MRSSPTSIWAFRHLIRRLVLSELRTGVARRKLGILWWLLDPILLLGVYWGVVVGLLGAGREVGGPYPLFLCAGLLLWKWISSSLGRGSASFVARPGLLKSVAVPLAVIPISLALGGAIPWGVAMALLFFISTVVGQISIEISVLQAVPLFFLTTVLVVSLSGIASLTTVYVRDLTGLLPHMLRATYYLSPGLWSLEALQAKVGAELFQIYLFINPAAIPMDSWRRITFNGGVIDPFHWKIMMAHCVVLICITAFLFRRYESDVVRRL